MSSNTSLAMTVTSHITSCDKQHYHPSHHSNTTHKQHYQSITSHTTHLSHHSNTHKQSTLTQNMDVNRQNSGLLLNCYYK